MSSGKFSLLNGGASFRWSFGPLAAWGSKESSTILTTHPSLEKMTSKIPYAVIFSENYDEIQLEIFKIWTISDRSSSVWAFHDVISSQVGDFHNKGLNRTAILNLSDH